VFTLTSEFEYESDMDDGDMGDGDAGVVMAESLFYEAEGNIL